ncbi:hypothetical protein AAG589_04300 [Isoptericola sp. F-RaC21]|uniref:hypothetical protein n=1 Tax=Isoptericola sp. F-RaC21 TaxID=3141452 RepID=UPI00315BC7C9
MSDQFLTVGYTPLLSAGFPLHDAPGQRDTFLTVGYTPKLGTSFYPYPDEEED